MGTTRFRKPKLTRSDVPLGGASSGPGSQTPLAVTHVACPLCDVRAADTKVSLGPVSVEICKPCSEPLWNAMGLLSWSRKFFK